MRSKSCGIALEPATSNVGVRYSGSLRNLQVGHERQRQRGMRGCPAGNSQYLMEFRKPGATYLPFRRTRSSRRKATQVTISPTGTPRPASGWWKASTGSGATVLNGTTRHRPEWWRRRGETTATCRRFTISGRWKPVEKSHIRTVPGHGWKVIGIRVPSGYYACCLPWLPGST
jgi:hypothetical protein